MDGAMIERLVDLLLALDRAGIVELVADGDALRYRPRCALTPDLAARLKAHKADLLTVLRPRGAPDGDDPGAALATLRAAVAVESADTIDWWQHILDEDRAYLLGPRDWPQPCPWCGGRLRHNPLCVELRASWEPSLPFGKHKGKRLGDVPRDYLAWLLANGASLDAGLRAAVEEAIGKRGPGDRGGENSRQGA